MKASAIKKNLYELKITFRKIWEDGAEDVIDAAISELEASKNEFDRRSTKSHDKKLVPEPWGYCISPKQPLRFRRSIVLKGLPCWLDLYCTLLWKNEEELPVQQDITLRLWSNESSYICREDWDSERVLDILTSQSGGPRVMARWHFDLAHPGQDGPKYHLQFGGNARDEEYYWFPEIVKLPRFVYPPMDLILVCQMIAANFYRDEYDDIREDPIWAGSVRDSQQEFLLRYYKNCVSVIDQEQSLSLLDVLWNI